jgi:hypothetical protein
MKPRLPENRSRTPRYARPCTATSDAITPRRRPIRSSAVSGGGAGRAPSRPSRRAIIPVSGRATDGDRGAGGAGSSVAGTGGIDLRSLAPTSDTFACRHARNDSRRSRASRSSTPSVAAASIRSRAYSR